MSVVHSILEEALVPEFTPVQRVRLRAQVAEAARVIHPAWPLRTFIAVNPLGGLEDRPWEEAVEEAGAALHVGGYPSTDWFHEAYASGRITDADLDAALRRRHPDLDERSAVAVGGRVLSALEVARLDLLHGPPAGAGPILQRTPGEWCDELLGTQIAPAVDDEVAGWCAAFLDEGQAGWTMPDRAGGFYAAWRALAERDRGARRLGAGDLRAAVRALPERAEDALLVAMAALAVGEDEAVGHLRRQLGRQPGWASAVRYHAEKAPAAAGPIDLVALLAVRGFYEAALVRAAATQAFGEAGGLGALRERIAGHRTGARRVEDPEARVTALLGALELGRDELDPEGPARLRDLLAGIDPAGHPATWLEAYEGAYRDGLLADLARPPRPAPTERAAAQAVFCIDVRSEGLRRYLEALGSYETLGFAGFFAVAISYTGLGAQQADALCPVLLEPRNDVVERPLPGQDAAVARHLEAGRRHAAARQAFHDVKSDVGSKFALAEAAGWALGPLAAVKTGAPGPYGRLRRRLTAAEAGEPASQPEVDRRTLEEAEGIVAAEERAALRELLAARLGRRGRRLGDADVEDLRRHALGLVPEAPRALGDADRAAVVRAAREEAGVTRRGHTDRLERVGARGFTLDEQVGWAKIALSFMGLTGGFARLVLLCAHGSQTENNPYESSLDCGACGGNQGGPTARVAAAILNRPAVRDGLRAEGIDIPPDTWFLAGQHDTCSDEVRVLDLHAVPAGHRAELARLERDLADAGRRLSLERCRHLPRVRAADPEAAAAHVAARATDWGQVAPEWGLARNAAFVIGPRSLTAGLDLGCRTFLHSYDPEGDADETALETILTAPLVVAEWINLQYYFSTVEPERLGAGTKTLHNVVGRIGVQQGAGGDLRIGLPWQSVMAGGRPYHEPMRLLAVVQAPLERIDAIVERNTILQHLLGGGWIAMAARADERAPWRRRRRDGSWQDWDEAAGRPHTTTEVAA